MRIIYYASQRIYLSEQPVEGAKEQYAVQETDIFHKELERIEAAPEAHSEGLCFYGRPFDELWELFHKSFKFVQAAGGLVQEQKEGKYLAMYRRGHWDLPKGKMDPGESKAQTALREVQEETGLKNPKLSDFLVTTYHIYRDRKETWSLKPTYWYAMQSLETEVVGQVEEDIEELRWLSLEELKALHPIFPSIKDVLACV